MTMTVASTFGAKGESAYLSLGNVAETVTYDFSGTYAATVQVERSVTPDPNGAWELVAGPFSVANATVHGQVQGRPNDRIRVRCVAYTSGTVSYSFVDENAVLFRFRDGDGVAFLVIRQDGTINDLPTAELAAVDPSQKVTLLDDFAGTTLATRWAAISGNDAQVIAAAHVAGTVNGEVAMTTGNNSPGTTAVDAAGLVGARNWKAAAGGLFMEARVKLDDITLTKAFVGFTDSVALEFPVISNGTTGITATADDAVGFLFDTLATTDVWSGCGVAATVSAGAVVNGSAPVNDTYDTLRVEINVSGDATFYVNGNVIGTKTGAVTASVLLTPIIIAMENSVVGVRKLTCDYIHVQQNR
jgi:hypothetical protein